MHKIGALWLSHKTCDVLELEEVADQLTLDLFSEDPRVSGYAIIKTCNRVEAYITSEYPREVLEDVAKRLKLEKSGIFVGKDAVEHLMRVSCGLEAMIVGEDQILGQIKKCHRDSRKEGAIDSLLDMAFERAIKAAKRARSETKINEGSVSIGSAAVELADMISGGLDGKSIVVIGAGDMGTLVAKALSKKSLKAMFIANRTYTKARRLAGELCCEVVKLDDKEKYLSACDIAICTTSAPHYILDFKLMARVMEHRRTDNELLIIDIANPKDVEERVGELKGIELYDLDSLYEISEENLKRRLSEVSKVERIIEEELEIFQYILNRQKAEVLITMLYKHGYHVMEEEKKRALRYLEKGRDRKEVLEGFSHAVLAKTLHTPTKILRNYTDANFIDFLILQFEKEFGADTESNAYSESDTHNGFEALETEGAQNEERDGAEREHPPARSEVRS
ncbi:MAG: glutamyl-tRNA reductase [Methanosarcinales archaeon]|nr:glutamyl-tRNA reductase [Methanosarcinales archaeon]